jgi:thioesterase domain-containing protein
LSNFDFDFSDDENASTAEIFEKIIAYINQNNSGISGIEQQDILKSFELYKNNSFALRTHKPRKYTGDVTLLRATRNPNYLIGKGDHSDWKEVIDGQLNVINISADHFSVMTKPAVKKVAQIIKIF